MVYREGKEKRYQSFGTAQKSVGALLRICCGLVDRNYGITKVFQKFIFSSRYIEYPQTSMIFTPQPMNHWLSYSTVTQLACIQLNTDTLSSTQRVSQQNEFTVSVKLISRWEYQIMRGWLSRWEVWNRHTIYNR